MLPKLRVILTTVIATCAVVLVISAGLVATRDPSDRLAGVPSMSRPLVQQSIVEDTDWQHSRLLAYSRRVDELARLRDLPTAPARAVVEYAERAKKADERAGAPAATVIAPAPMRVAPAPSRVATTPSAPPSEPAAAVATAAQPAPAVVASAPAAAPAVPAAPAPSSIAQPAAAPAVAAITVEPTAAPGGGTQVASVPSRSDEAEGVKVTEKPGGAKLRHRAKAHARKEVHKKAVRVARTQAPTDVQIPAAAKTGFPVDVPNKSTRTTPGNAPSVRDSRQDSAQD